MKFTKMQGLGNDFIIIDNREGIVAEENYEEMVVSLCDRHYGIGADGVMFVLPSTEADYRMRIFNSDGSEAEMCGNGIRCFAKYIYDTISDENDVISVETLAGIIIPTIITQNEVAVAVEVDMGEPRLQRSRIPMVGEESPTVINEPVMVDGEEYKVTAVSMGNPHAVIFVDNVQNMSIDKIGPKLENHDLFPEKTNVEFIQVLNKNELIMRVWERGSGETLACGTGACASLVAAVLNEKADRSAIVHLLGGDLSIEWQKEDNHVIMTGPAVKVFDGEISEQDFAG